MTIKADVAFDEILGLLINNNVSKEAAEKISKEFINYLRKEKNLDSNRIDDYFKDLLSKYSIEKDDILKIMDHFSMMSNTCIDSCNRCFSDLDGDGTLIALSNKVIDGYKNPDANEEDLFEAQIDKQTKIFELIGKARYYRNNAGDDKKAIEISNQILEMDSNNRDAMLIKAGALDSIGRNKEALNLINTIKEKWPNHWEAYYLFGIHLFNKNERKAMRALKRSLELNENFNNLTVTAQLAYFMGKSNYKEYLDKAKKLAPERFNNFMDQYWEY